MYFRSSMFFKVCRPSELPAELWILVAKRNPSERTAAATCFAKARDSFVMQIAMPLMKCRTVPVRKQVALSMTDCRPARFQATRGSFLPGPLQLTVPSCERTASLSGFRCRRFQFRSVRSFCQSCLWFWIGNGADKRAFLELVQIIQNMLLHI